MKDNLGPACGCSQGLAEKHIRLAKFADESWSGDWLELEAAWRRIKDDSRQKSHRAVFT